MLQNHFIFAMGVRQPRSCSGGLPPLQVCSLGGSDVSGTVSHFEEEGSFFWLQRDPEKVEEIGILLEKKAEQLEGNQNCPFVGDVVVAQWQEAFYRAVVLGVNEDNENVLLYFVDWGNRDWVARSMLRLASQEEVQEPPQAIRWICYTLMCNNFYNQVPTGRWLQQQVGGGAREI